MESKTKMKFLSVIFMSVFVSRVCVATLVDYTYVTYLLNVATLITQEHPVEFRNTSLYEVSYFPKTHYWYITYIKNDLLSLAMEKKEDGTNCFNRRKRIIVFNEQDLIWKCYVGVSFSPLARVAQGRYVNEVALGRTFIDAILEQANVEMFDLLHISFSNGQATCSIQIEFNVNSKHIKIDEKINFDAKTNSFNEIE